jgi:hypothetical protein
VEAINSSTKYLLRRSSYMKITKKAKTIILVAVVAIALSATLAVKEGGRGTGSAKHNIEVAIDPPGG